MEKQYVLVEYHFDGRISVKEYPVALVGTSEECQRAMLARFGKACIECQKESMVSGVVDTEEEHARLQDENGLWRIEWWIINTGECKDIR